MLTVSRPAVVGAKELAQKGKGNVYGEAIVLDTKGQPLGRARSTRPIKLSAHAPSPHWGDLLALYVSPPAL
jgi:hypothetical protein